MNLKPVERVIFVNNWVVEEISQLSREKIKERFQGNQMIFLWYSDLEFNLIEGQVLSFSDLNSLSLIWRPLEREKNIPYAERREEMRARETRRELLLLDYQKQYLSLSASSAHEMVKKFKSDEEVYYRCFYNSLKMYRLRSYIFDLAKEMVKLVGHTPEETISAFLEQFRQLNFDNILVRNLEKASQMDFCLDCNDPKVWAEESVQLVGTFNLFLSGLDFMARFTDRLQTGKVFFNEDRFLTWDEAGAMEVWTVWCQLRTGDDKLKKQFLKTKT